jgi:hypothetical protein
MEGGFSSSEYNMSKTNTGTNPEHEVIQSPDLGRQIAESAQKTREELGLNGVPEKARIGTIKAAWGSTYEIAIRAKIVGLNSVVDRAMATMSARMGGVRKSEIPVGWKEPETPRVRRSGESPSAWEAYASFMLNGRDPQFETDPAKIEELKRESRFDHILPINKIPDSTDQIEEAMRAVLLSKDLAPTRVGKNGVPVTEYRLIKDASEVVCLDSNDLTSAENAPVDKVVVIKRNGDESAEELARMSSLLDNNKAVVVVVNDQDVGPYVHMIANHEYIDGVEAASVVTEFANFKTATNDYLGGDRKLATIAEQLSVAGKVQVLSQRGDAEGAKRIIEKTKQDPEKVKLLLEKASHRFNLGKDNENGAVKSMVLDDEKKQEISRLYNQLNSRIKSLGVDGLAKGITPATFLQLYFAEAQETNGRDVRAGVLQYSPDLSLELDLLSLPGTIGELVSAVDSGDKAKVARIADIFSVKNVPAGKKFPNESKIGGLIGKALEGVRDPLAKRELADVTAKLAGTAISGQNMYSVIPEGFVPKTPDISPVAISRMSETEKAFVRTRNNAVKGWGGPAMARFIYNASTITYASSPGEDGNIVFDQIVVRTKSKWESFRNK